LPFRSYIKHKKIQEIRYNIKYNINRFAERDGWMIPRKRKLLRGCTKSLATKESEKYGRQKECLRFGQWPPRFSLGLACLSYWTIVGMELIPAIYIMLIAAEVMATVWNRPGFMKVRRQINFTRAKPATFLRLITFLAIKLYILTHLQFTFCITLNLLLIYKSLKCIYLSIKVILDNRKFNYKTEK